MCVIGIDPGLSGGLCVLNKNGIVDLLKMPLCVRPHRKGNYIDLEIIHNFISKYSCKKTDSLKGIFIERQFILRNQGMSSGSKTMYQSGLLYGICFSQTKNLNEINAKDWQKYIFSLVDETIVNKYTFTNETKIKSVAYVEQNYGISNLFTSKRQTKPSDGLADAIGIASYGLSTIKK